MTERHRSPAGVRTAAQLEQRPGELAVNVGEFLVELLARIAPKKTLSNPIHEVDDRERRLQALFLLGKAGAVLIGPRHSALDLLDGDSEPRGYGGVGKMVDDLQQEDFAISFPHPVENADRTLHAFLERSHSIALQRSPVNGAIFERANKTALQFLARYAKQLSDFGIGTILDEPEQEGLAKLARHPVERPGRILQTLGR